MTAPTRSSGPRYQSLRKLTEVSRAMSYAVSLEEVLDLTVVRAAELMEVDRAVLLLANDDGNLTVAAAVGVDAHARGQFSSTLEETMLIPLAALLDRPATGIVAVPLVLGGTVTGILAAPGMSGREGPETEWLLSALADQAAVAIEKARLADAAHLRERLMSIVGHDLRNPLAAVVMATQAMLNNGQLGPRDERLARRVAHSAARMDEMLSELLDFARSRMGGGISIHPEVTSLDKLCRQVAEELEGTHGARMRLDLQSQAHGMWDAARLAQVVSNLVGNAIEYGLPDTLVTLSTRDDDGSALILVHNEGPPIAPELLPELFEPFRRGGLSVRHSSRNLGLGLFIAEQIVTAHKGTIGVRSDDKDGTVFTVRLPCTAAE